MVMFKGVNLRGAVARPLGDERRTNKVRNREKNRKKLCFNLPSKFRQQGRFTTAPMPGKNKLIILWSAVYNALL